MHAYRDQYATLFRNGRGVVLIGISTDSAEDLGSWARDDEFPFLMASDPGAEAGKLYGAFIERASGPSDNRTLFVIDPEGRISYVAAPFRELDPTAYTELGEAIDQVSPAADSGGA
jgi:peroxiredoxin Q/BCP